MRPGLIKILEKAGKLEVLRLVLYIFYRFADSYLTPLKLSIAKFDNLSIVLGYLRGNDRDKEVDSS